MRPYSWEKFHAILKSPILGWTLESSSHQKIFNNSGTTKTILGIHTAPDEAAAQQIAELALKTARKKGTLNDAADLMEEAFNKWPELRTRYEYQIKLWSRGISM